MQRASTPTAILRENNEKMRQEFTANVSHELKTPLTSISGYAELIETGIAKPEDVPDFGRKIHSEATRMIQLVNDILQLSKLDTVSETGDTPVMETVDLLKVAKECVERQKLNARRAYISLTYLGESAPVLVAARCWMNCARICATTPSATTARAVRYKSSPPATVTDTAP